MRLWYLQLLLIIPFSINANGASPYSEGLKAYMRDDFVGARNYWLQAAAENDAVAMFNLGLLHQKGKVERASSIKAENWFRLSGKHGYAAADFHLANYMLQSGSGDEKQILGLLRRAAERGFLPAISRLETFIVDSPELVNPDDQIDENLEQILISTSDDDSLRIERYLKEAWIRQQPDSSWTIQLSVFSSEDRVLEYIDAYALRDNAAFYKAPRDSIAAYKLVYGSYPNLKAAEAAATDLRRKTNNLEASVRAMIEVHAEINRAG